MLFRTICIIFLKYAYLYSFSNGKANNAFTFVCVSLNNICIFICLFDKTKTPLLVVPAKSTQNQKQLKVSGSE